MPDKSSLRWREFQDGLCAETPACRWYILPASRAGWWKLQKAWSSPMKAFTETWKQPFEKIQEAKAVAEAG